MTSKLFCGVIYVINFVWQKLRSYTPYPFWGRGHFVWFPYKLSLGGDYMENEKKKGTRNSGERENWNFSTTKDAMKKRFGGHMYNMLVLSQKKFENITITLRNYFSKKLKKKTNSPLPPRVQDEVRYLTKIFLQQSSEHMLLPKKIWSSLSH